VAGNPHYFPLLTREEAQAYLEPTDVGTFLLRDSSKDQCLVISLKQSQKILHLLVLRRDKGFGVDPSAWKTHPIGTESFPTLDLLISRLKQLKMLKTGLTSEDLSKRDAERKQNGASNTTPTDAVDALGQQGREEMKRVLQQSVVDALEHEYKGMLVAMTMDNRIGSQELATLAQWRQKHHFSDVQHEKVLTSMGINPAEFEKLKDFKERADERTLCIICLDQPKSCVFVDCGHMATCFECGDRVRECPVCRRPKTKIMKVFT